MRRATALLGIALAVLFMTVVTASAGPYTGSPPVGASAAVSPFATCTADDVAGQVGTNHPNTEVEPWVDVNPTDGDNIVATWQQDRWSNGGARGLVAGVSLNGGTSWTRVVLPFSTCGGNEDWVRASDPWHSFAPDGVVHAISLSASGGITAAEGLPDSGILVSNSDDGGLTWSDPITLKQDEGPNVLNDKESITADPNDAEVVYAVWDRVVIGAQQAPPVQVFQHAIGFRGPTWFSRTTDGGESWEPARMIFDPGGVNQTIGNQIVVLPNGDVLDFFDLIFNFKNAKGVRGFNVAFIRSTDQGETWSQSARIVDKLFRVIVRDPDTGAALRTADFNPDVAVDPASGKLYAVWQDGRFSGNTRSDVAFTTSSNGGTTWTPTVKLNLNSAGTSAFLPSVHVADDGTVGVSFYDFRNNTPDPDTLPTDNWLIHCHTACSTPANWTETHVDGPFDSQNFPQAGGFFPGDYLGLDNVGSDFASLYITSGATANSADAFYASVGP
jgi:BNR/Asp-box repeat